MAGGTPANPAALVEWRKRGPANPAALVEWRERGPANPDALAG
jgi:hypothetical protein